MTRILYIEDEPNNRMLVRRMIMMMASDWEYAEADNATLGIQKALELRPDLILMDISMPDMDGLTATGKIRQLPDIAHTPIIALTANAMEGDRERFLAAGCDGYISKPIDIDTFIDSVREYLDKAKAAQQKTVAQTAPLRSIEKPPTMVSRPAGLAEAVAAKTAAMGAKPATAPSKPATLPTRPASLPIKPASLPAKPLPAPATPEVKPVAAAPVEASAPATPVTAAPPEASAPAAPEATPVAAPISPPAQPTEPTPSATALPTAGTLAVTPDPKPNAQPEAAQKEHTNGGGQ
jgi:two-component system cell cycle response regulator DivK